MGKDVKVAAASILHGSLTVQIETSFAVSQPQPLATGQTQVVPQVAVGAKEEKARSLSLKNGATVEELVRALVAIGSTPRDIIAILQSLKATGSIEAEIEVI
jgi:flagellar P-ring protein FlgI